MEATGRAQAEEQAGPLTVQDVRRYFPTEFGLTRTMVAVPEHNVLYVKNPKAGCSTIALWLDRIHTNEHTFRPRNIHVEHRLPGVRELGVERVVQMLAGDAFRFTFVRNPLTRVESAWRDKVVRGKKVRPKLQRTLDLPIDPESPLTFDQFLAAIELQDPVGQNRHWRPQHLNLMHPLVEFDHIGKLEHFDAELAVVRERAGLPDVPWEASNVMPRGGESVNDGRPDLVRRVEAAYATDFELYGY
jgi:hypothetical protein